MHLCTCLRTCLYRCSDTCSNTCLDRNLIIWLCRRPYPCLCTPAHTAAIMNDVESSGSCVISGTCPFDSSSETRARSSRRAAARCTWRSHHTMQRWSCEADARYAPVRPHSGECATVQQSVQQRNSQRNSALVTPVQHSVQLSVQQSVQLSVQQRDSATVQQSR